ncbi:TonB-dependent receptor [Gluconacetobacter azotocaptans]|uniref:TonB-dependent receptor n=1 Tax=Gluconacetobacter azotocaptans TaxID=142834 RepID=A0A7W4JTA5_9PROT|nr:TonB-dependent receptor [Gluconacetobacter azotocaptans]MBB2190519.1 TonB-dependent receptor [Gluconacetobacter azotocaptans]MBM9402354.1 TonB-dependent receptor [Gluconacetobacter azotocaptans]GBQ28463.1 TonB-dependent ferric iron siderophore receptor [Gluconacetobacter azotocaptans DSM 13594]
MNWKERKSGQPFTIAGVGLVLLSSASHAAENKPANPSRPPVSGPQQHAPASQYTPTAQHILVTGRNVSGAVADYNKKSAYLGPLGNKSALDTPMSIQSVPHDVLVNQQARNLNDLMGYMPSVQLEVRGDPNTSRPQSRGFEADVVANTRIDGLNMTSTTPYAAEMFEDVQVLNGVAGALYGAQNPAGTFSYTAKRPTDTPINRLVVGVDSIGQLMENADVSGRIGKNKWFGYRINLLHGDGTTYVQDSWMRRNLVSADFDIHFDSKTVLELDASHYTYVQRGTAPGFNIPFGMTYLPKAPDLSKPHLGQDYAGYNMETNMYLAKIKHTINKDWSFTLGGLYEDSLRQSFGNTNALAATGPVGQYTQTIAAATTANDFRVGSNLAYINGHFHTGFISHDIVIGTNGYMMGNYNPTSGQSFTLGKSNMYAPTVLPGRQPYYHGRYESAYVRNQAMILGDTLHFDRHWSIMGTLTWNWLSQDNRLSKATSVKDGNTSYSYTTPLGWSSKHIDAAFSPMASLLYKPVDNQTAYFTYGRAIQAGVQAPVSATNANQMTQPFRSEEYEVGYKVSYRKLLFTVDGFRMNRPYAFMNEAGEFGTFGMQTNYGVEAMVQGYITPRLSVLAGMTWLDAQIGDTGNAATDNKQVVGAPPIQSNILLDYRLPIPHGAFASGLAVNANVHYVGRRAATVTNSAFADSYVTLDLGTRYPFFVARHPWAARFGVSNVTNEQYWSSLYPATNNGSLSTTQAGSSAYAGLPRTFHFTLEADF